MSHVKAKIDEEGRVIEKIKNLAGGAFTRLFVTTVSYKLVERFREEAATLLPKSRRKQVDQALPERECTSCQLRDHRTRNRLIQRGSEMRFHNNIGPQVRRRRYALGWSQSMLATKLQLSGFDISRSGVSKIEARLRFVDDKDLMFLAEVLKFQSRNFSRGAKAQGAYPTSWRSWIRQGSEGVAPRSAMAPTAGLLSSREHQARKKAVQALDLIAATRSRRTAATWTPRKFGAPPSSLPVSNLPFAQ
jgi:transcriptional regulator with XRE-family HTH domain